ncbi:ras-related protein Rab-36 isoform X2 [Clinocottus analis]|uniref:ras-related protein Rab-36 isoform X2 n=1 Tax=Clinocottus analis TaxID=304258 RepID=UPI0035BF71C5
MLSCNNCIVVNESVLIVLTYSAIKVKLSRDTVATVWLPGKRAPRQTVSRLAAAASGNIREIQDIHGYFICGKVTLLPAADWITSRCGRDTSVSLKLDSGVVNVPVVMQGNRNGMIPFPPPPISRDRVICEFPELKKDWDLQAKVTCKDGAARHQLWDRQRMSKVVVVGDLNVGKTCLINRFCKDVFESDYKATIGVDFEIERFEVSGVPFSLQIWDTAGQEKFKCIASAYYRGAQVIITAFDMADIKSLDHTRQWLEEALRENEPDSCFIFLVGTKNDLLPLDERQKTEKDAVRIATEMHAEFWAVSAKTGENVQGFFFRVAALAFEKCVLKDTENELPASIGHGGSIKSDCANLEKASPQDMRRGCC